MSFTRAQPFQGQLKQNQEVARVQGKTQVHNVDIELAVVLGRCLMPMQNLLKMGRGAVIPLDTKESDQLWILAAGHPIARGEITIQGERLCITVTEPADVHEFNAVGG
jgi:flagellar motor switch protein FliN/FliY